MKSSILWGLIGLNAVLLFLFVVQPFHSSVAQAQVSRPSDYLILPGEIPGGNAELVYIIDTTNKKLTGVAFDNNAQSLQSLPVLNLATVFSNFGANPGAGGGMRGY